jgi:outer membrane receptor protein involved in Fe transport
VLQYRNDGALRTTGVEFELNGKLWNRVESSASIALQDAAGRQPLDRLSNSPRQVSKARLGVPFFRDRLFLAGALQAFSSRQAGEDARLGGAWLVDFTATARVHPHFDLQVGVRNALDRRYEDPVCLTIDRLPGDGRSAFVKLVWRAWE